MKKHFYRSEIYATTLDALQTSCIFRSDAFALAYKNNEETHAIACDSHNTPVNIAIGQVDLNAFDAYGHSSLNTSLPVAFNGERFDAFSSHYWLGNGYRSYLPILRRFNSPDDLSPFSKGGINAYAYTSGDPVNFIDPTGNFRQHKPLLKPSTNFEAPAILLGKAVTDQPYGRALLIAYPDDGTTVIKGHGSATRGTIGDYKPKEVLKLMKDEHLELADGPIHLFSCSGGRQNRDDPFKKPNGQKLANLTGRAVTTYKNTVYHFQQYNQGSFSTKIDPTYDPKPITFYPQKRFNLFKRMMSLFRKKDDLRGA